MLGGNSLDHPLVLPGQNKYLAVVTGDDVTGPHSTIYLHKQNITSLKMHENTISIVITWFANLTKFAVTSEGSDNVCDSREDAHSWTRCYTNCPCTEYAI